MPIRKLLVANRGEIAVRVFRTCRELGIATVAVVAPDDAGSLHGRSADETVEIAGYLHSEEHIRAAKETGADAIHPGYGFLAENADFAEAVEAAGLTWVGPPPEALRLGGDKIAAKRIARRGGRPHAARRDAGGDRLPARREGGGRRRRTRHARRRGSAQRSTKRSRRRSARRSARSATGRLYSERYLERPRHVEVQLLADAHGNVVALGERDCSVQRRHQKVLEEAPAPEACHRGCATRCSTPPSRSAVRSATGAPGTVEFVVDGGAFYFLELNGRIQVEHPVTEAVTGLDLDRGAAAHRGRRGALHRYVDDRPDTPSRCASTRRIPRTFLPQTGRSSGSGCQVTTCHKASGSTRAWRRATRSGSRTTR